MSPRGNEDELVDIPIVSTHVSAYMNPGFVWTGCGSYDPSNV